MENATTYRILVTYNDLGQDIVEVSCECFSDALIEAIKETGCATVICARALEENEERDCNIWQSLKQP